MRVTEVWVEEAQEREGWAATALEEIQEEWVEARGREVGLVPVASGKVGAAVRAEEETAERAADMRARGREEERTAPEGEWEELRAGGGAEAGLVGWGATVAMVVRGESLAVEAAAVPARLVAGVRAPVASGTVVVAGVERGLVD